MYSYLISHETFRNILQHKANEQKKKLNIVCEAYTTKTCGGCGFINDVGRQRSFNCSECNIRMDRDLNASRNILIKHL
jgi:transposase